MLLVSDRPLMLSVHQSNRLESLVPALAEVCAAPMSDVLAPERIVVPNTGMARWISLALADAQGVCMNADFSLPASLVWDLWRNVLPDVPEEAVFSPRVLAWRIMAWLRELPADGPAPLCTYLDGGDDLRHHDLATHIATALDQYLVYRPQMVLGWEEGELATRHPDEEWQAELWRSLVQSGGTRHRARLLEEFLRISATEDNLSSLPPRLSVFGLPALPPAIFHVLRAVAEQIDVHIFVLNPCRAYWMEALPDRSIARIAGDRDPSELYLEAGNSLLSSMGGQGRDFLASIVDEECVQRELFVEPQGESVLAHLQRDILELSRPGHLAEPRHAVAADDNSIQVRGAYSRMREIEALHDHLLDLFDQDPNLDPSDIRVMMPSIDEYAPLVDAVFGAVPDDRKVPFAIADLRARAENPVVDAFLSLIELPRGRYEAPDVLALLETEALRARFGISQDDLPRITQWVRSSGIRWAIDAEGREHLGLPAEEENTWRFGLDRMMFGYAMSGNGSETFEGILPLEGVEGTEAVTMGEFQRFAGAIRSLSDELRGDRPVAEWCKALGAVAVDFFDISIAGDDLDGLFEALEQIGAEADLADFALPVSLEVVRAALEAKLGSPGASWAFLSGRVTFCTLVPMRSVPAKIVCILGLNDGEFPRSHRPPSFDLMARNFRPGDRARRDDDRYLFLEAILSARESLYLSHVSRSPRDNSEAPPSILLAELEEAIAEGFVTEGSDEAPVVRLEHRLQAFSPRYFSGDEPYFSYREDLARALETRDQNPAVRPFVSQRLPEPDQEWRTISVERLARFVRSPAKFFLRDRLGIRLDEAEAIVPATENFGFDGLERFRLRESLLARGLDDEDLDESLRLIRAGGELPHGTAGSVFVEDVADEFAEFLLTVRKAQPANEARTLSVDLEIDSFRIVGEVERVYGEERFEVSVGRKKRDKFKFDERKLIDLWVRQLALCASGLPVRTHCIAPDEDLWILEEPDARSRLAEILELYWQGLCEPLPFFPRLATKFFNSRIKDPIKSSRTDFLSDRAGIWTLSPEYKLIWPEGGEALDGRFAEYATRLWGPLHGRVEVTKKPRSREK